MDDFLHCRTREFEKEVSEKLDELFLMGRTLVKIFKYMGTGIEQGTDNGIKVKIWHLDLTHKIKTR